MPQYLFRSCSVDQARAALISKRSNLRRRWSEHRWATGEPTFDPSHGGSQGILAAFRFQVKLLRPDLPETAADRLHLDDLKGDTATQLAELLWARDDLMRRAPAPVTGPVTGDLRTPGSADIRNERCRDCGRNWYELREASLGGFSQMRRWRAYCHSCAWPRERAYQRDRRRRDPAEHRCECGQSFTAREDARYCSNACRQRAYRQRGGR
jgi:hypothetical protein